MELFRLLGLLVEPPAPGHERAAAVLELGSPPGAAEHTDLFEFQLFPYASVYLGAEGMMGGEACDRIAGFWRALGETPPSEADHLTVLLASYAELMEREAEAGSAEIGSRWRHARSAFLWEHLLSWLPVYVDKVAEIGSDFYRRWSRLLEAALIEEARAIPAPSALSLHLREAPPLGDLADAGGDQFLAAATAPVRTGFILTRTDLESCARAIGLGLRKGERRYALKALLGQAPRETLEWLAAEARRWEARHGARDSALATVSEFWRERTHLSSRFLADSAASLGLE